MSKVSHVRIKPGANSVQPDVQSFLSRLEQQLIHLERKIDVVIAQNSQKPKEPVSAVPPAPRERVMFKAVCADCASPCEVPFKPTAERPVYCKACWARRRSGSRGNAVQRTPEEVKKAFGSLKASDLKKIAKGKKVRVKAPKPAKKKVKKAKK